MEPCKLCSTPFKPKDYRQKMCSDSCRIKARAERDKLKRKAKPKVSKDCQTCGKSFVMRTGNVKFCSDPCRRKVHGEHYGTNKFKQYQKEYKDKRFAPEIESPALKSLNDTFYSLVRPRAASIKRSCLRCQVHFQSKDSLRTCAQCQYVINRTPHLAQFTVTVPSSAS